MHSDDQGLASTRELPRQRSLPCPVPPPVTLTQPRTQPVREGHGAGWYPDPAGTGLRFYDGERWTPQRWEQAYPDAPERVSPSGRIVRTLTESLQWEHAGELERRGTRSLARAGARSATDPEPRQPRREADDPLEWGNLVEVRHWLLGLALVLAVLGVSAPVALLPAAGLACVWGAQLRRQRVWERVRVQLSGRGSTTCPGHASVVWLRTRGRSYELGVLTLLGGQLGFFDAHGRLRWLRDTPTLTAQGIGEATTLRVGPVGGRGRARARAWGGKRTRHHSERWRELLLTHARHGRCASSALPPSLAALALALPQGRALEAGHCLELPAGAGSECEGD